MAEYTLISLVAVGGVIAAELFWLRTGLLRRRAYVLTMAIVGGFQIIVDGWLTKQSAPIVRYEPSRISGIRFPWDIPVEDFLFGFALLTLVLLLWERAGGTLAGGQRANGERSGWDRTGREEA